MPNSPPKSNLPGLDVQFGSDISSGLSALSFGSMGSRAAPGPSTAAAVKMPSAPRSGAAPSPADAPVGVSQANDVVTGAGSASIIPDSSQGTQSAAADLSGSVVVNQPPQSQQGTSSAVSAGMSTAPAAAAQSATAHRSLPTQSQPPVSAVANSAMMSGVGQHSAMSQQGSSGVHSSTSAMPQILGHRKLHTEWASCFPCYPCLQ